MQTRFDAALLRADGPSLSPEFVRSVFEPKVDVQAAQVRESMQHMSREDLEAIVMDLRERLAASSQRVLALEAAARRHHAEVFPR